MVHLLTTLLLFGLLFLGCTPASTTSDSTVPAHRMAGSLECPAPASCIRSAGVADGGTFSVLAPSVVYGPVVTVREGVTTADGSTGLMTYSVPPNSAGVVAAIISGRQDRDGGGGGTSTWSCGVAAQGTVCETFVPCAAVQPWAGTRDGGWTATLGFPGDGGCVAVVSVHGNVDGGRTNWSTVIQYASAH